jgi:hypothetical protein
MAVTFDHLGYFIQLDDPALINQTAVDFLVA